MTIHDATGIATGALEGRPLSEYSVADRMAWAGKRNATKAEDKAYSLFGVFEVHLPLLYGEGEKKAFRRLREEIAKSRGDKSSRRDARRSQRAVKLETSPSSALDRNPYDTAREKSWCLILVMWIAVIFGGMFVLAFAWGFVSELMSPRNNS
jgi:hypothetical protein